MKLVDKRSDYSQNENTEMSIKSAINDRLYDNIPDEDLSSMNSRQLDELVEMFSSLMDVLVEKGLLDAGDIEKVFPRIKVLDEEETEKHEGPNPMLSILQKVRRNAIKIIEEELWKTKTQ